MSTSMAQPKYDLQRGRYGRRGASPQYYDTKGPVSEYAAPEDYGTEAYSKDMQYTDGPAPEPTYAPPPSGGYPGYNRYTGNDVNRMISNDRDFAYGRGDELFQNAKDRAANEGQRRQHQLHQLPHQLSQYQEVKQCQQVASAMQAHLYVNMRVN